MWRGSIFPLDTWDQCLPQVLLTLNLLRGARLNPQLSAYYFRNGLYNFNRRPLGPLGCNLMVHELPEQRTTWAPHTVEGFYLGPALNHYRCYRTWIPATRSERVANTIVWLAQHISVPKTSSADAAISAAQELIYALQNPHPVSALSPLQDLNVAALYNS